MECLEEREQTNPAYYLQVLLGVLQEQGVEIPPTCRILDFGCGEGQAVYDLRQRGLQAFGVDITPRHEAIQQRLKKEGLIQDTEAVFSTLDMSHYRIPFEDNTFDVVISWMVFEHVQNWPQALAEIKRVLKPGGASLHVFPARYRPIEGHVFVPLASIIRAYPYLAFWALLGVRKPSQHGMGWKEVARNNSEYLNKYTVYLSQAQVRRYVEAEFGTMAFLEEGYMRHHPRSRARRVYSLSRVVPFIPRLVRTFHMNVVFFKKP